MNDSKNWNVSWFDAISHGTLSLMTHWENIQFIAEVFWLQHVPNIIVAKSNHSKFLPIGIDDYEITGYEIIWKIEYFHKTILCQ